MQVLKLLQLMSNLMPSRLVLKMTEPLMVKVMSTMSLMSVRELMSEMITLMIKLMTWKWELLTLEREPDMLLSKLKSLVCLMTSLSISKNQWKEWWKMKSPLPPLSLTGKSLLKMKRLSLPVTGKEKSLPLLTSKSPLMSNKLSSTLAKPNTLLRTLTLTKLVVLMRPLRLLTIERRMVRSKRSTCSVKLKLNINVWPLILTIKWELELVKMLQEKKWPTTLEMSNEELDDVFYIHMILKLKC